MKLTNQEIQLILNTHDALWEAYYNLNDSFQSLEYKGETYPINKPSHQGYASVIIPNDNGTPFLWITQNLNKSSYGTSLIEKHKQEGKQTQLTWIVDTRSGRFRYVSHIYTTKDKDQNLIYGLIESYDSFGTEVLWSTIPSEIPRKAAF